VSSAEILDLERLTTGAGTRRQRQANWLGRYAWGLVVATWLLIVVGGYVRVTGSGMGCSGWPDCDGRWLPVADMKAWIEMGHRYSAGAVSLLVALTFAAALRARRKHPRVLRAAALAVMLIVVQIGLGAWTVFTGNRGDTVVAHLVAALLLLAAATWAAVATMEPSNIAVTRRAARLYAGLAVVVLVLAAVGGAV
jgi:heme a synthase